MGTPKLCFNFGEPLPPSRAEGSSQSQAVAELERCELRSGAAGRRILIVEGCRKRREKLLDFKIHFSFSKKFMGRQLRGSHAAVVARVSR